MFGRWKRQTLRERLRSMNYHLIVREEEIKELTAKLNQTTRKVKEYEVGLNGECVPGPHCKGCEHCIDTDINDPPRVLNGGGVLFFSEEECRYVYHSNANAIRCELQIPCQKYSSNKKKDGE